MGERETGREREGEKDDFSRGVDVFSCNFLANIGQCYMLELKMGFKATCKLWIL